MWNSKCCIDMQKCRMQNIALRCRNVKVGMQNNLDEPEQWGGGGAKPQRSRRQLKRGCHMQTNIQPYMQTRQCRATYRSFICWNLTVGSHADQHIALYVDSRLYSVGQHIGLYVEQHICMDVSHAEQQKSNMESNILTRHMQLRSNIYKIGLCLYVEQINSLSRRKRPLTGNL